MPLREKCILWSQSKNLQEKPIVLAIKKYDEAIEITIKYISGTFVYRKFILLALIIILNLIFLILQVANVEIYVPIFLFSVYAFYNAIYNVKFERLIVVEKLGYQIEVHHSFGATVQYIAWEQIKSIFINEVISKQRVIFILALLIHDKHEKCDRIIPLFKDLIPRLPCLESIYQHIETFHN